MSSLTKFGGSMDKPKYESGQTIPDNVMSALLYVSKVGVLSTAHWHRQFAKGNLRWRQKQLKSMSDKKLIRRHTSVREGFWVLNTAGVKLVKESGQDVVTPVTSQHFIHDEFVGESLFILEQKNICERWLTEAELKLGGSDHFQLKSRDKKCKYPDAVFQVQIEKDEHLVALEYERIGKAFTRYVDLLFAYQNLSDIRLIIYIVEEDAIRKRIQKAMAHIGSNFLNSRIAFVSKSEWIEDPTAAKLVMLKGNPIILEKVCKPYKVAA